MRPRNSSRFCQRTHEGDSHDFVRLIRLPEAREVSMARSDVTDFEWDVIQPLLPTKVRGVKRVDDRRVLNGIVCGCAWLRPGWIFRRATGLTGLREPLEPLGQGRALAAHSPSCVRGLSGGCPDDRQILDRGAPAGRQPVPSRRKHAFAERGSRNAIRSRCMGRSRGGLTTKTRPWRTRWAARSP